MSVNINIEHRILSKRYLYRSRFPWYEKKDNVIYNLLLKLNENKNEEVRKKVNSCPLCGRTNAILISMRDRYGFPLSTLICSECEFIYSHEIFSEKFIQFYYGEYAIKFKRGSESLGSLFDKRTLKSAYCWTRKFFFESSFDNINETKKIVDIVEFGCSDGANLFPYYIEGKKVYGFDYDMERIKYGRSRGLNLYKGSLDEFIRLKIKPNLIILSHFIEHLVNIDVFLSRLYECIPNMTYLYVEVPGIRFLVRPKKRIENIDNYRSSMNLLDNIQLEHNYFFDLKTLVMFFKRNGFRLIQGDEIVRAVFIKDDSNSHLEKSINYEYGNIFDYLKSIEKEYMKRWFYRLIHFLAKFKRKLWQKCQALLVNDY